MRARSLRTAAVIVGAVSTLGCGQRDIVAEFVGGSLPDACPGVQSCDAGAADGGTADAGMREANAFALCACEDLLVTAPLTLRAAAAQEAASLATLGGVHLEAPLSLDGNLRVVARQGLTATDQASLEVGESLQVGGDLDGEFVVRSGGDASVAGDVRVRELWVGGVLTVPEASELSAPDELHYAALRRSPVLVEAPCACDPDALARATRAIEQVRGEPGLEHLDDAAYAGFSGTASMTLGCGAHWVRRIGGDGDLSVSVQAPATLYVDGPIALEGGLELQFSPGASLRMVVAGSIRVGGAALLGEPDGPERVELLSDGAQIALEAGGRLRGTVDAPAAELLVGGEFSMRGSLHVRRVANNADMTLSYEEGAALKAVCD